jgi:hypothetical protein
VGFTVIPPTLTTYIDSLRQVRAQAGDRTQAELVDDLFYMQMDRGRPGSARRVRTFLGVFARRLPRREYLFLEGAISFRGRRGISQVAPRWCSPPGIAARMCYCHSIPRGWGSSAFASTHLRSALPSVSGGGFMCKHTLRFAGVCPLCPRMPWSRRWNRIVRRCGSLRSPAFPVRA